MITENTAQGETPEPSLVLSFDDIEKMYNSLQEAKKLRRRGKQKTSDAYKGPLNSEPGIRFETHSYFFAEYSDPVPSHASERNPFTAAHVSVFQFSTPEVALAQANRIYSFFTENSMAVCLVLHDHPATKVCYRSSKCRLFQPLLDRRTDLH